MVDLNAVVAACLTINPTGKVAKVIDIPQQFQWWGSRLQSTGQIARGAFEYSEPWFSNDFSRLGNKLIFRRDIALRLTFRHFRSLFGLVDSNAGSGDNGEACSLTPYFPQVQAAEPSGNTVRRPHSVGASGGRVHARSPGNKNGFAP